MEVGVHGHVHKAESTSADVVIAREKRGQCPGCAQQTYRIGCCGLTRTPLTMDGRVDNGTCLKCHPVVALAEVVPVVPVAMAAVDATAEGAGVVQSPIKVEVDATGENQQRFCQACFRGNAALVQDMLSKRLADPNMEAPVKYPDATWNDRPLGHATSAGAHLDVMECLLNHGAAVDGLSSYGSAALHIAAQEGALPAVKLLVERFGASIKLCSADGKDAIAWTAGSGKAGEAYDGGKAARTETARWLADAQSKGAA